MSRIILAIVEFFEMHIDDADFFNNTDGNQWLRISLIPASTDHINGVVKGTVAWNGQSLSSCWKEII